MLENTRAEFERVRDLAWSPAPGDSSAQNLSGGGDSAPAGAGAEAAEAANARRLAWFTDDDLRAELRRRALDGGGR